MNKTIEDLASRWLKRRADGLSMLESRVLKSTIDRTTISRDTNKAVAGTGVFASEAAAREHMNQVIADDPSMAGAIHVVPQFELNQAA